MAGTWALFSILATLPNVWFGKMTLKGIDVDPYVDAMHGGLFGLSCLLLIHG